MEFLQPEFIKFNKNEELPKSIRGKYFLYYGMGLYAFNGIPGIYVSLDSIDKLYSFIIKASKDNNILLFGTDDFVLNKDYYLNNSLYTKLTIVSKNSITNDYFIEEKNMLDSGSSEGSSENVNIAYLPNYIIDNGINYEFFESIDMYDEVLEYYKIRNKYIDFSFSEEEILSFCSTLCRLIIDMTVYKTVTNVDMIYKQVLYYFANYLSDDVLIGMTLVFGNKLNYTNNTNSITCGCETDINSDAICASSCVEYYKTAMTEYLKILFSDYNFYKNWFFIHEEGVEDIPNIELISKLKILINEFLSVYSDNKIIDVNEYGCPSITKQNTACYSSVINNFLKILDYIENNEMEENCNKIKVYGEEFGKQLPSLSF